MWLMSMEKEALLVAGRAPLRDAPLRGSEAYSSTQGRLWIRILLGAFIAIGLVVKSFLFVDGEPVLIHYALNGFIVGLAGIAYFSAGGRNLLASPIALALGFALFWSLVSALFSPISLNIVAVAAFAVVSVCSLIFFPALCLRVGVEPWRLLTYILGATVPLTALLWLVDPALVTDPESGRFSGALVSVAVACNIYFFVCVFAFRGALLASSRGISMVYGLTSMVSLVFLYLTKTRSSLAECLACLMLMMIFSPMRRGAKMVSMGVAGLLLMFVALSGLAASTGIVPLDDELESFRLGDEQLTDARSSNWEFGIERIIQAPLFGEGLLTKQTQGGTRGVDFAGETSYDPRYDPHSLILSFGVQGGIPFMIAMTALIVLILSRFVAMFGIQRSLESPEFVIASVHFAVMIFAGGDLTTLGNVIDKIFWILLGTVALKTELARAYGIPRGGLLSGSTPRDHIFRAASPRPLPTKV
jgi:O-antigen ligase